MQVGYIMYPKCMHTHTGMKKMKIKMHIWIHLSSAQSTSKCVQPYQNAHTLTQTPIMSLRLRSVRLVLNIFKQGCCHNLLLRSAPRVPGKENNHFSELQQQVVKAISFQDAAKVTAAGPITCSIFKVTGHLQFGNTRVFRFWLNSCVLQ